MCIRDRQFIDHIVDRRGGKLKGAHEDLFSGAFWTGATAVELGLIDGLGECRALITKRFGEDVDLLSVQPKKKLFSGLGGLSGSLAGSRSETLRGDAVTGLVDEMVAHAVERAHLSRFGL